MVALKKASKTSDQLLATQGMDAEKVLVDFKAVRKQASLREKSRAKAA